MIFNNEWNACRNTLAETDNRNLKQMIRVALEKSYPHIIRMDSHHYSWPRVLEVLGQ